MFKDFLKSELKKKKWKGTSEGDFLADVQRDKNFREFKSWNEFKDYLFFYRSCDEAFRSARLFWKTWKSGDGLVMAKKEVVKVDGLSPKDRQKVSNAIRQIWQRSYPRRLCVARSIGEDGFPFCEKCKKTVPKVHIDHREAVGDLLNGGVERLFCSSNRLQGFL